MGCSQAVRHQTLTLAFRWFEPIHPSQVEPKLNRKVWFWFFYYVPQGFSDFGGRSNSQRNMHFSRAFALFFCCFMHWRVFYHYLNLMWIFSLLTVILETVLCRERRLTRVRGVVGYFAKRQTKIPEGVVVLALLCLTTTPRRGSCQLFRGINRFFECIIQTFA